MLVGSKGDDGRIDPLRKDNEVKDFCGIDDLASFQIDELDVRILIHVIESGQDLQLIYGRQANFFLHAGRLAAFLDGVY